MKTETVQEMQIATGKVIKAGVEIFSAKIDEETKEVKNKLKDTEKEIERAKSDIRYERGFRKFFFWAPPEGGGWKMPDMKRKRCWLYGGETTGRLNPTSFMGLSYAGNLKYALSLF